MQKNRRFLSLWIDLLDLVGFLRLHGHIDDAHYPADLRLVDVHVTQALVPLSITLSLESDSLPDDCLYKGYIAGVKLELYPHAFPLAKSTEPVQCPCNARAMPVQWLFYWPEGYRPNEAEAAAAQELIDRTRQTMQAAVPLLPEGTTIKLGRLPPPGLVIEELPA